jgi:hypothetical protein
VRPLLIAPVTLGMPATHPPPGQEWRVDYRAGQLHDASAPSGVAGRGNQRAGVRAGNRQTVGREHTRIVAVVSIGAIRSSDEHVGANDRDRELGGHPAIGPCCRELRTGSDAGPNAVTVAPCLDVVPNAPERERSGHRVEGAVLWCFWWHQLGTRPARCSAHDQTRSDCSADSFPRPPPPHSRKISSRSSARRAASKWS